jgi:hypothetical protein
MQEAADFDISSDTLVKGNRPLLRPSTAGWIIEGKVGFFEGPKYGHKDVASL